MEKIPFLGRIFRWFSPKVMAGDHTQVASGNNAFVERMGRAASIVAQPGGINSLFSQAPENEAPPAPSTNSSVTQTKQPFLAFIEAFAGGAQQSMAAPSAPTTASASAAAPSTPQRPLSKQPFLAFIQSFARARGSNGVSG